MKVLMPDHVRPLAELRRVHLVGIGGAGLSGIARIMLGRGVAVSGSDASDSPTLEALRGLGARCDVGHSPGHLGDAEVVVVSTAVREDNPEVVEARRRRVPLWSRAAALVSCMSGYRVLAVAGTHGKTTTTSMLTMALVQAGADPTYAIGADLTGTGINAAVGAGGDFVVEADESDGAFLTYSPFATVVTNVDADHLDEWGTEEAYRQAFADYLERIQPGGFLVTCVDDPGAATLAAQATERGIETVTVALEAAADLRATDVVAADGSTTATVVRDGAAVGELRLQVPGRHYVLDALAALALGLRLGHPAGALLAGLAAYSGSRRRMEPLGEAGGVRIRDSYAHHPVEIVGDVEAARSLTSRRGRLVVCFQPHLVSRTKALGAAMGQALGGADLVVVCDVYVAREDPEEGVSGLLVAAAVPLAAEQVVYAATLDEALSRLDELVRPGDLVLTLGAGDVTTVGPRLLELLRAREARR